MYRPIVHTEKTIHHVQFITIELNYSLRILYASFSFALARIGLCKRDEMRVTRAFNDSWWKLRDMQQRRVKQVHSNSIDEKIVDAHAGPSDLLSGPMDRNNL